MRTALELSGEEFDGSGYPAWMHQVNLGNCKGDWEHTEGGSRLIFIDPILFGRSFPDTQSYMIANVPSCDAMIRRTAMSLGLLGMVCSLARQMERANRNIGHDFVLACENRVEGVSGGTLSRQWKIPRKSVLRRVSSIWRDVLAQADDPRFCEMADASIGKHLRGISDHDDSHTHGPSLDDLVDDICALRMGLLKMCSDREVGLRTPLRAFCSELAQQHRATGLAPSAMLSWPQHTSSTPLWDRAAEQVPEERQERLRELVRSYLERIGVL